MNLIFNIQLKKTDSDSNISLLLTLIFSAIVISAPFCYAALLTINWWLLDNQHYMDAFKQKFGALYEHLDLTKGRIVILEPVGFLLRRMLIAYVCIFPTTLTYQYLALYASILWQIIFNGVVQPFKSKKDNRMTIFNESVIMICLYQFICFSDFVPDVNTRFMIGYVCSAVVCAHFIFSITLIIGVNIKTCREQRKLRILK